MIDERSERLQVYYLVFTIHISYLVFTIIYLIKILYIPTGFFHNYFYVSSRVWKFYKYIRIFI